MESINQKWWLFIFFTFFFSGVSLAEDGPEYQILESGTLRLPRRGNGSVELDEWGTVQVCFLESPTGEIFQLVPFNNFNVTISNITEITLTCGFRITDMFIGLQGDWTLKATIKQPLVPLEHYQQTWTIEIEEYVEAIPGNEISTYVGEDVYIELKSPIEFNECIMRMPDSLSESEQTRASTTMVNEDCHFSLINAGKNFNGQWTFGGVGIFTVLSNVTIEVKDYPVISEEDSNITLLRTFPVSLALGPPEAIHCKVKDPMNREHSFNGQCSIEIERVFHTHEGSWTVLYGLKNSIHTIEHTYTITVVEDPIAPHPDIIRESYELSSDKKSLNVKCTLMTKMKGCRMIRDDGTTFILNQGNGQGNYSYYGKGTYEDKDGNPISECGIRVENPKEEDLQRWHCIFVKDDDTEVGKILSPFENGSDDIFDDKNNGTITTPTSNVMVSHEGNPLELRCNHNEKIDYCWFLSPNRTIYSAVPDAQNPEYDTSGYSFAIGECGIKIYNARRQDTGLWKCNMGVASGVDLQTDINVTIHGSLVVAVSKSVNVWSDFVIGCQTYDNTPVEYCRFIRPDGTGINPNKVSGSYFGNATDLSQGQCYLEIIDAQNYDVGLWSCIAKPFGDREHLDDIYVYNYYWFGMASKKWSIITLVFYIVVTVALFGTVLCLVTRSKVGKKYANKVRESIRKRRGPPDDNIQTSNA